MVVTRALLVTSLLAPAAAAADPVCLPKALFPKGDAYVPTFDLGHVAGVPTLCAHADSEIGGLVGCWAIDPKTGALSASTATALPGHSQHRKTDAKGCIDGYCAPKAAAGEVLMFVTSTDGAHAAILRDTSLYVFDTKTKKQTKVVPLSDEKAPDNTNVGNSPVEVLYAGNALYVVGTDAGPYIAVWSFKDDGKRTGVVGGGISVYSGGVNVLDDTKVGLANPGLQSLMVVNAADGKATIVKRAVKSAPCKPEDMEYLGETDEPSKGCSKTLAKNFIPWANLDPILLPSGEYLVALAGAGRGSLAILDPVKLAGKKRFKLKRCSK
jgi:hypothetical protein